MVRWVSATRARALFLKSNHVFIESTQLRLLQNTGHEQSEPSWWPHFACGNSYHDQHDWGISLEGNFINTAAESGWLVHSLLVPVSSLTPTKWHLQSSPSSEHSHVITRQLFSGWRFCCSGLENVTDHLEIAIRKILHSYTLTMIWGICTCGLRKSFAFIYMVKIRHLIILAAVKGMKKLRQSVFSWPSSIVHHQMQLKTTRQTFWLGSWQNSTSTLTRNSHFVGKKYRCHSQTATGMFSFWCTV